MRAVLAWVSRSQPSSSIDSSDVSPNFDRRSDSMSRAFERYVGIDYSGAETANSSLSALRVYEASPGKEATEIRTTGGPKIHWTRQSIAEWLVERLSETHPTLIGIDHGFSFPLKYFQKYGLPTNGPRFWPTFKSIGRQTWTTPTSISFGKASVETLRLDAVIRGGDA